MKDLDKFNKLAEEFKEKITENNSNSESIGNVTETDKVHSIYNNIMSNVEVLQKKYNELSAKYTAFCDSYIQSICYLLYFNQIDEMIASYKKLSDMINLFIGKDSKINIFLKKIEEYLIIIKSTSSTDEEKKIAKSELQKCLNEFLEYIMELAKENGHDYSLKEGPAFYEEPEAPNFIEKKLENSNLYYKISNKTSYASIECHPTTIESDKATEESYVYSTFMRDLSKAKSVSFKLKNTGTSDSINISYSMKIDLSKNSESTGITTISLSASEPEKTVNINLKSDNSENNKYKFLVLSATTDPSNKSGYFEIYDIKFEGLEYDKKINIKDRKSKFNVNETSIENSSFQMYYGSLNRANMIAQQSHIYIKQNIQANGNFKDSIEITAPALNFFNANFIHKPYNWWFFNIYDYIYQKISENNGENKDYEDYSYLVDTNTVRFGSVFSPDTIKPDAKSQSVCFKFADGDWINGYVYLGNKYKLQRITISPKFNGSSKDPTIKHFSDDVEISQIYTSFSSDGASHNYTIKGKLSYDRELTETKNAEIIDRIQLVQQSKKQNDYIANVDLGKEGTFYKGTFKMYDDYGNDVGSAANGISGNLANKDVICEIVYDQKNKTIDVYCSINTENTQSLMYNRDATGSDIDILPPIAASFTCKNLKVSDSAVFNSAEEQIFSDLLSIGALGKHNSSTNFEFDEKIYYNSLKSFMKLKDTLLEKLIKSLSIISNTLMSCVMINSFLPQYDSNYTNEYTSDIMNSFSRMSSEIQVYTTGNYFKPEELYNNVVYNKLLNGSDAIKSQFKLFADNFFEAEHIYKEWTSKLKPITGKIINIDLSSTAKGMYLILTTKLSSFVALRSSGSYSFINLDLMSYDVWMDYFDKIFDIKEHRHEIDNNKKYFISSSDKALLYITTQIYDSLKDWPKSDSINQIISMTVRMIKNILINNMYNNWGKTYEGKYLYSEVINENLFNNIYFPFYRIKDKYIISSGNINVDYLNPYIYQLLPNTQLFNSYDLNEMLESGNTDSDFYPRYVCPLIYISLLKKSNFSDINKSMTSLFNFLMNGQKLNIRELIILIGLLLTYKDLKSDREISKYITCFDRIDVDNIYNTLVREYILIKKYYKTSYTNNDILEDFLNTKYISTTSNIRIRIPVVHTSAESGGNPIKKMATTIQNSVSYSITLCDLLLNNIISAYTEYDATEEENGGVVNE